MRIKWWIDLPWKLKAVLGSMRRDIAEIQLSLSELPPLFSALERSQGETTNELKRELIELKRVLIEQLRVLREAEIPSLSRLLQGEIREHGLLAETAARQSQRAAAETRIRKGLIPPPFREEGISVLIPNWNHAELLRVATASACATLDVLPVPGEVLILDDASRDGSREVAQELARVDKRIRLILCDENLGLPRARNVLLCQARFEHAMILDSDNQLVPPGIATFCTPRSRYRSAVLAFGNVLRVDATGAVVDVVSNECATADLAERNWIDAMVLVRTDRILELGGYECQWVYGVEDWELESKVAASSGRAGSCSCARPRRKKYRISRLSMHRPRGTSFGAAANEFRRVMFAADAVRRIPRGIARRSHHPAIGYLERRKPLVGR